jgi:hypothetical protein
MGGVATYLGFMPQQDIAVAVLCNASARMPGEIAGEILTLLVPGRAGSGGGSNPGPVKYPPGKWRGAIETYRGSVPLTLEVAESGEITAKLGSQPPVKIAPGAMLRMTGDIGTDDANRTKHVLTLDLKRRGDVLNGGVTAQSVPSVRPGNALTYWAELRRE